MPIQRKNNGPEDFENNLLSEIRSVRSELVSIKEENLAFKSRIIESKESNLNRWFQSMFILLAMLALAIGVTGLIAPYWFTKMAREEFDKAARDSVSAFEATERARAFAEEAAQVAENFFSKIEEYEERINIPAVTVAEIPVIQFSSTGEIKSIIEITEPAVKSMDVTMEEADVMEVEAVNEQLVVDEAPDVSPISDRELLWTAALKAQKDGQWNDAVAFWKSLINLDPESPQAYFSLGNALTQFGRLKITPETVELNNEAIDNYMRATALDPNYHEAFSNWGTALSNLASLHRDKSLFLDAFDKYSMSVVIEPDLPETYTNWGNALAGLSDIDDDESLFHEALEKYAEAVRVDPDFYEAYRHWGIALSGMAVRKKDYNLYLDAYDKYALASWIKPEDNRAYTNWGNALLDQARQNSDERLLHESIEKFTEAIRHEPNDYVAYYKWGNSMVHLARIVSDEDILRGSFEKYADAVQINPNFYEAWNNWGVTLMSMAELNKDADLYRESFDKFAEMARIKPDDQGIYTNWGNSLIGLAMLTENNQFISEASIKFKKAEEIQTGSAAFSLARYASLTKKSEKCLFYLEKAKKYGTLPDLARLEQDTALNFVRKKDWFRKFMSDLSVGL